MVPTGTGQGPGWSRWSAASALALPVWAGSCCLPCPCFAQLPAWHRGPLPAPLGLQAGAVAESSVCSLHPSSMARAQLSRRLLWGPAVLLIHLSLRKRGVLCYQDVASTVRPCFACRLRLLFLLLTGPGELGVVAQLRASSQVSTLPSSAPLPVACPPRPAAGVSLSKSAAEAEEADARLQEASGPRIPRGDGVALGWVSAAITVLGGVRMGDEGGAWQRFGHIAGAHFSSPSRPG